MRSQDILGPLLKSVSRSLYLSLRVLPSPLRPVMGLGYLFCRAADTLADTDSLAPKERLEALQEFKNLFSGFPLNPALLKKFQARLMDRVGGATPSEERLLQRFGDAADAFTLLSRSDQALVQEVVMGVIRGMELDLRAFGTEGGAIRSLSKTEDLENYLRWIGGEPGRFWTKCCLAHMPIMVSNRDGWIEDGIQFGTGLQLINILRDLPQDLKRGRCYFPTDILEKFEVSAEDLVTGANSERALTLYHAMIDDALARLLHGRRYLEALPSRYFRLRAGAWWPLAIGMETLGRLRALEKMPIPERVRVPRWKLYWMLALSPVVLGSNRLLGMEFEDLFEAASSTSGFPTS